MNSQALIQSSTTTIISPLSSTTVTASTSFVGNYETAAAIDSTSLSSNDTLFVTIAILIIVGLTTIIAIHHRRLDNIHEAKKTYRDYE